VWVEDDQVYEADTVIIATGASAKFLGIQSEEDYKGRGVSACATCDGFFYRKKTVAVVGGGDTACEEANYLAGLCQKVYMIVRKPYLRASEIMQQRVKDNPKIEILFEHNTLKLTGESKVEGADLVYKKGSPEEEVRHIDIDGFFLAIGHKPNTDIFTDYLECDAEGYIKVEGHSPCTNVAGVFAAGDCADPHYRQAIVAAASGCKAAMEAEKYLAALA
jgi:thioredoxin reductase (NADPH)